jgi:hypothetical protein
MLRLRGLIKGFCAYLYAMGLVVVVMLCAAILAWGPILWAVCAISGAVLGMGLVNNKWGWKPIFYVALFLAASKFLSIFYYTHAEHVTLFDAPDMILGPLLYIGCGIVAGAYCRRLPTNYWR